MPLPKNMLRAQEEAQRYVDENDLDKLMTKLMNDLMIKKPEDVKLFMIRWLTERCTHEELDEAGLIKAPVSTRNDLLAEASPSSQHTGRRKSSQLTAMSGFSNSKLAKPARASINKSPSGTPLPSASPSPSRQSSAARTRDPERRSTMPRSPSKQSSATS